MHQATLYKHHIISQAEFWWQLHPGCLSGIKKMLSRLSTDHKQKEVSKIKQNNSVWQELKENQTAVKHTAWNAVKLRLDAKSFIYSTLLSWQSLLLFLQICQQFILSCLQSKLLKKFVLKSNIKPAINHTYITQIWIVWWTLVSN